jgi:hypothetical protein
MIKRFKACSSVIDKCKFLSIGEQDCWSNRVLSFVLFGNDVNQGRRISTSATIRKTLVKNEGFLYAV